MTVLVAITYHGCPDTVGRAVRSALDQTWRDLHVVVLGDGDEPPGLPHDPRLTVHVTPENRGTYFAHAVMLAASPFGWYAPLDADDWLDPDHIASLMATSPTEVVLPRRVRLWAPERSPRVFGSGAYHVGLMPTQRLRSVGGYDPTERIGQDSLVIRMLRLTGPILAAPTVTYNRTRRPDSLTMSRETGHRSEARRQVRVRNLQVARAAARLGTAERIRRFREGRVLPSVMSEVATQAAALRMSILSATAVAA